jgi:hypothetical protein
MQRRLRREQQRVHAIGGKAAAAHVVVDAGRLGGEHVIEQPRRAHEAVEVHRIFFVPEHRRDRSLSTPPHDVGERVVAVVGIRRDPLLPRLADAAPCRLDEQQLRLEHGKLHAPRARVDREQRHLRFETGTREIVDDRRERSAANGDGRRGRWP